MFWIWTHVHKRTVWRLSSLWNLIRMSSSLRATGLSSRLPNSWAWCFCIAKLKVSWKSCSSPLIRSSSIRSTFRQNYAMALINRYVHHHQKWQKDTSHCITLKRVRQRVPSDTTLIPSPNPPVSTDFALRIDLCTWFLHLFLRSIPFTDECKFTSGCYFISWNSRVWADKNHQTTHFNKDLVSMCGQVLWTAI